MSFNIIYICLISASVIMVSAFVGSGHFFRSLFLSALSGTGALFAVSVLSQMTGVSIGINPITLLISSLGGIPSVIAMLSVRYLLLS